MENLRRVAKWSGSAELTRELWILWLTLASAFVFESSCASAQQQRTPDMTAEPTTRFVELDGLSIRVQMAGIDRQPGHPALVLESGGSLPLETWDPVLPELASLAAVVAYDRAGTGESEWDSLPPTPERVVGRLRRLLEHLGVQPPYLLIGHSWGGALTRYHAEAYPDDIAGILYIDPTDVTLTERDQIAMFESFGAGEAEYAAFTRLMETAMANAPGPMKSESDVILSILRSDSETRGLLSAPEVPTSVIVAGRVSPPPQSLVPFDAERYAAAMHESQVRRLQTWVRGGGRFHIARNAGHTVHADDPRLVIDEVRQLLFANR